MRKLGTGDAVGQDLARTAPLAVSGWHCSKVPKSKLSARSLGLNEQQRRVLHSVANTIDDELLVRNQIERMGMESTILLLACDY